MRERYTGMVFLLLLILISPVPAVIPDASPVPSVSVICTPPPCPAGGSLACPPSGNGCPGGCGVICKTPAIVCTPPPCPAGGSLACPPSGNGCPGGCGVVCATPTTPVSATEPLLIIGGIALCLLVIGRRNR